jgi:predicted nucleotidyltransferase
MLDQTEYTKLATTLKQVLLDHYGSRMEKLVLFGSYARGDYQKDSDIDFMIVFNDEQLDYFEEMSNIVDLKTALSLDYDITISSIPMEAQRYELEDSPLLLNVREEGVAI